MEQFLLLNTSVDSIVQFITACLIFAFVLVICIFTTRFVGNFNKQQYSNKNIQIIETVRIANNKYIQLLLIGEVYLVVAVSKDTIQVLAQLTKEELPEIVKAGSFDNQPSFSGAMKESFDSIFEKMKKK